MNCPGGNANDPIWRVLASSLGISCWTPLKPQHSNPNPNPLVNQLWCIDFLTLPTPLTTPHRLPAFLESLCHWKTDAQFMQDGHLAWKTVWSIPYISVAFRKTVWSIPYISVAFFPSLKQNFIAYRSSKVSSRLDWIFEIQHFSRVYSNCCCSCSFEPEIIKIGQSSHKIYSNKILNFQESTTVLNTSTKKSGNLLNAPCIYQLVLAMVWDLYWFTACFFFFVC